MALTVGSASDLLLAFAGGGGGNVDVVDYREVDLAGEELDPLSVDVNAFHAAGSFLEEGALG